MTLAVYPMRQRISKVGYIARCLDGIAGLGLEIEALCLDRKFYTRKVFRVSDPVAGAVHRPGQRTRELRRCTLHRPAV